MADMGVETGVFENDSTRNTRVRRVRTGSLGPTNCIYRCRNIRCYDGRNGVRLMSRREVLEWEEEVKTELRELGQDA